MNFVVIVSLVVQFFIAGGPQQAGFVVAVPPQYYGQACRLAARQYRTELGAKEGARFDSMECAEALVRYDQ